MLGKAADGARDDGLHMVIQARMTFDGLIGIDIDLHILLPFVHQSHQVAPGTLFHLTPFALACQIIAVWNLCID
jgi:hypothetical protein